MGTQLRTVNLRFLSSRSLQTTQCVECILCAAIFRPPGTLVPKVLCFTADVFFRRATSELRRPIAVKLCHMIVIWVFFMMQVQKFGVPPPKEIGGQNMQNSARFQTTSNFDREYLRNGSRYPKLENGLFQAVSSRVPRKKSDEFWSTNYRELEVSLDPPNCTFRQTIFRPLGGAGPSNFNTHYRLTKAC